MKIAVVGATGLVGSVMLKVLEQRNFPAQEVLLVASEKSVGKELLFRGQKLRVMGMQEAVDQKPQIAIFSAGGKTSLAWAQKFVEVGCFVIDNSSAWRMQEAVPLIVPEINARLLQKKDLIIANPNCSTIQMVMALAPLHQKYQIKRLVISTYQSVTGTGVEAVNQLMGERAGLDVKKVYPQAIDLNLFPHGGDFLDNGYTTEEMKLVHETRKILGDPSIQASATVVRVPVTGGHSEAVNVEFHQEFDLEDVKNILKKSPGIVVLDNPELNQYPTPQTAHEKDEVFVGRIRRDESQPKTLNLWIVSDNLRKGAATNAIQIAEYLVEEKLV